MLSARSLTFSGCHFSGRHDCRRCRRSPRPLVRDHGLASRLEFSPRTAFGMRAMRWQYFIAASKRAQKRSAGFYVTGRPPPTSRINILDFLLIKFSLCDALEDAAMLHFLLFFADTYPLTLRKSDLRLSDYLLPAGLTLAIARCSLITQASFVRFCFLLGFDITYA